jgi:hypothetical protein
MKRAMLLSSFVAFGFSMMLVYAAGVDFSGEWILSERIPSFGGEIPQVSLVIEQTGNDLKITRSMIEEDKTIESYYTLDGSENLNTEPNAAGPVTIRSTSKWENGVLVLEGSSIFADPDEVVTTKWKIEYQLTENGETLAATKTIPTPFGDAVVSEIFIRKQLPARTKATRECDYWRAVRASSARAKHLRISRASPRRHRSK